MLFQRVIFAPSPASGEILQPAFGMTDSTHNRSNSLDDSLLLALVIIAADMKSVFALALPRPSTSTQRASFSYEPCRAKSISSAGEILQHHIITTMAAVTRDTDGKNRLIP
jgi:hypothetical protein